MELQESIGFTCVRGITDRVETGYFDHIAAVFTAKQHPIILLEETAMAWMAAGVFAEENVDLLVKDNQVDDIIADFLATGLYERVQEQVEPGREHVFGKFSYRYEDPYSRKVPRLKLIQKQEDDCLSKMVPGMVLNLWSESHYKLSTTSEMVEIPDLNLKNFVLVEDRFDPYPDDDMSHTYHKTLARGFPVFWPILARSAEAEYRLYIPSLPRLIDALLDQLRHRQAHMEEYTGHFTSPQNGHLCELMYHLHLEIPSQREKLIPELAERNRADMEIFLMTKLKRGRMPRHMILPPLIVK